MNLQASILTFATIGMSVIPASMAHADEAECRAAITTRVDTADAAQEVRSDATIPAGHGVAIVFDTTESRVIEIRRIESTVPTTACLIVAQTEGGDSLDVGTVVLVDGGSASFQFVTPNALARVTVVSE